MIKFSQFNKKSEKNEPINKWLWDEDQLIPIDENSTEIDQNKSKTDNSTLKENSISNSLNYNNKILLIDALFENTMSDNEITGIHPDKLRDFLRGFDAPYNISYNHIIAGNIGNRLNNTKMLPKHIEAAHFYTQQAGHEPMNQQLRTGSMSSLNQYHRTTEDQVHEHVKNLHELVNSNKLPHSIHVYRGFRTEFNPEKLLQDKHYQDNGFVSTSLNPDIAHNFGAASHHIAHIIVPKGHSGLWMHQPEFKNGFTSEKEVLLPPKTKFHYKGYEKIDLSNKDGGPWHIHHLEVEK